MKITKKIKTEILKVMDDYWNSYLAGDLDTFASTIDPEYKLIGTSESEILNSPEETFQWLNAQVEEVSGKAEFRDRKSDVYPINDLILVNEQSNIYLLIENEWTFYSKIRVSTLLRQRDTGWKVVQQHGSFPDSRTEEGETISFETLSRENLKLKEAVRRRTNELEIKNRELEIEATLETIRSRSLAVTKSEEFNEVVAVVFEKLGELGISVDSVLIALNIEGTKDLNVYGCGSSEGGTTVLNFQLPYFPNPFIDDALKAQKKLTSGYYSKVYTEEEKNQYYDYALKNTELKNLPPDIKKRIRDSRAYALSVAHTKSSIIMLNDMDGNILNNDDGDLLQRFSSVFEQVYIRFLDLQKAEAQAREAKIEAALEKVRSRSLAMHKADELGEVVTLVVKKLRELDIPVDDGVAIVTNIEGSKDQIEWMENPGFPAAIKFYQPYFDHPVLQDYWKAKNEGLDFIAPRYSAEENKSFLNHIFTLSDYKDTPQDVKDYCLAAESYSYSAAFQKNSSIFINDYSGRSLNESEIDIVKRFSRVFEQAYVRFLDLQKSEAQAREAQIEAALERIRSKSMAMHKTEDLGGVVQVLFEEMEGLSVAMDFGSVSIYIFKEGTKDFEQWLALPEGVRPLNVPHFDHPIMNDIYDFRTRGDEFLAKVYPVEVKNSWTEKGFEITDYKYLPEEFKASILAAPGYALTMTLEKNSGIMISSFEGKLLSEEDNMILKRVAKVFEQSYIRFLDLQKAEFQAREAQIEAALERTRTQSMMMQHSDELNKVSFVFHEQLLLLDLPSEFSYVWLPDEPNQTHMFWATWSEEVNGKLTPKSKAVTYPLDKKEPYTAACFEMWESDESVFVNPIAPEEVDHFFDTWSELLSGADNLKAEFFPDGLFYAEAYMKYGCFGINIRRQLTQEEQHILNRFSIEFERTYTRFLDLKKAETQARESQIEAALEKVRSRTMSMHRAEELKEVVTMVVEKLTELGVILDANGAILCTYFPDSRDVLHWVASPDFSFGGSYLLPYFDHPIFEAAWESRERGDEYFSESFTVEEKNSFYKHAFEHSDYKYFPDEFKEWIFQNDKHSLSFAWTENAAILIPSHTGVVPEGEDIEILKRFARVFEGAYVRFMDLQKTEKAARETQIELSLEKIRALVASMQESSDLLDIMVAIRSEFVSLGHEAHYFWYMRWLPDIYEKAMTSGDGTKIGNVLKLPRKIHGEIQNIAEWEKGNDPTIIHVMDPEAAIDYVHKMIAWGDFEQVDQNVPTDDILREIGGLTYVMARTSQGEIGYSLPGMVPDPPQEAVDTLVRFAGVFDLAYSRFEDLKEAELQSQILLQEKNRLERALSELKAAQTQLVHAEKMASLGELTAGIAHEIQNPLNFVNNFSEVSSEILDEMEEELDTGDIEEVKDILKDLKGNLEKITHHGHRASGIVRSMLDHSRTSSGEKVETDINALCDEYLRLAYHGMRAKDRSFNATMETSFDENLPRIKVISQDIGRVLLNLINNAFQAVSDLTGFANENDRTTMVISDSGNKSKSSNLAGLGPKVEVSTKNLGDKIQISVTDNGPGIPEEIVEKVFQPFFTTKPTGQGTGLGLSLSYDIIKAHGGKIDVQSVVGEGTTFTIIIPLTSQS